MEKRDRVNLKIVYRNKFMEPFNELIEEGVLSPEEIEDLNQVQLNTALNQAMFKKGPSRVESKIRERRRCKNFGKFIEKYCM